MPKNMRNLLHDIPGVFSKLRGSFKHVLRDLTDTLKSAQVGNIDTTTTQFNGDWRWLQSVLDQPPVDVLRNPVATQWQVRTYYASQPSPQVLEFTEEQRETSTANWPTTPSRNSLLVSHTGLRTMR